MVLEKADRKEESLQVCEAGCGDMPASIRFVRTGHRIAKSLGIPEAITPVAKMVHDRTLVLPYPRNHRKWRVAPDKETSVEGAVTTWLGGHGRKAYRSENELWTTLFVLAYEPVFFADVGGAWPAPLLTRPADLGTRAFVERRREHINVRHAEIHLLGAGAVVRKAWNERFGERISGVHWNRWTVDDLVCIADAIGTDALLELLSPFLYRWREAARGLPDLVLPPGVPLDIGGREVSPELVFVEVKGPGDSIRDAQRWWTGTLRGCGIRTEVWRVQPTQG